MAKTTKSFLKKERLLLEQNVAGVIAQNLADASKRYQILRV